MIIRKKRSARRFSIRALILAAYMIVIFSTLAVAIHAEGILHDGGEAIRKAGESIGDSVRDTGNAVGDAVASIADNAANGKVTDTDGKIGNESRLGTSAAPDSSAASEESVGWLGWVIAITVALIVIVLTVILIPKKKER